MRYRCLPAMCTARRSALRAHQEMAAIHGDAGDLPNMPFQPKPGAIAPPAPRLARLS